MAIAAEWVEPPHGERVPRGRGREAVRGSQRLLAEFLGTFLLVLGAAGALVVDDISQGQIGRAAEVEVPGLTVMAVILSMGAISGAHLDPAVTVRDVGLRSALRLPMGPRPPGS